VHQRETAPRRQLRVGCEFSLELAWPVHLVLQVEPHPDGVVGAVDSHLSLTPTVPVRPYIDGFGNICRRLDLPAGPATIRYEAEVDAGGDADPVVPDAELCPVSDLPDDALEFTLPTRLCPSDVLTNTAWKLFGDTEGGWARAQAVCDWVHTNLTFTPGSSITSTSAADVYLQREGVCRDFAHLAVTFLRALNVPARYCFGYLPDIDVSVTGPMDFIAWIEAYVGGRWYTFDPRNNVPRVGRVLIGRGRDALDVAMLTTYGVVTLVALRVAAEDAASPPWSSADPPILGSFNTGKEPG
jgi:transglutaminase-like putative cysteine protease